MATSIGNNDIAAKRAHRAVKSPHTSRRHLLPRRRPISRRKSHLNSKKKNAFNLKTVQLVQPSVSRGRDLQNDRALSHSRQIWQFFRDVGVPSPSNGRSNERPQPAAVERRRYECSQRCSPSNVHNGNTKIFSLQNSIVFLVVAGTEHFTIESNKVELSKIA